MGRPATPCVALRPALASLWAHALLWGTVRRTSGSRRPAPPGRGFPGGLRQAPPQRPPEAPRSQRTSRGSRCEVPHRRCRAGLQAWLSRTHPPPRGRGGRLRRARRAGGHGQRWSLEPPPAGEACWAWSWGWEAAVCPGVRGCRPLQRGGSAQQKASPRSPPTQGSGCPEQGLRGRTELLLLPPRLGSHWARAGTSAAATSAM